VICEVAGSHGLSAGDWLARLAVDAITPDEQIRYRKAWAEAALADYEAEHGRISPEEVAAAGRAWLA